MTIPWMERKSYFALPDFLKPNECMKCDNPSYKQAQDTHTH